MLARVLTLAVVQIATVYERVRYALGACFFLELMLTIVMLTIVNKREGTCCMFLACNISLFFNASATQGHLYLFRASIASLIG